MSDAWAVLLAGIGGFCLAYGLMQAREQGRGADKEFQLWRKEMRKMAVLITNHTPRQFGGCAGSKSSVMAVARLRRLHTALAIRLLPGDTTGLKLLSCLNKLIADIDGGKAGQESHAEVIRMFAVLLAQRGVMGHSSSVLSFNAFFRWLYNLPDYLTEYDRERKTN
ncbi:hypothetical protein [Desulfovibrio sp. JC010]|uniref:hypothetical protein n=1 Tax=Desulfovibrio sp. JC010 TaxID=2593641 RepID=UPI0013D5499C|nr:hypothetical protein [Desulfovibrio sp. JC010]NDV28743.1 hypothetical protein [Desulfovibrio sp. JC010]